jgi:hypothetical protein
MGAVSGLFDRFGWHGSRSGNTAVVFLAVFWGVCGRELTESLVGSEVGESARASKSSVLLAVAACCLAGISAFHVVELVVGGSASVKAALGAAAIEFVVSTGIGVVMVWWTARRGRRSTTPNELRSNP